MIARRLLSAGTSILLFSIVAFSLASCGRGKDSAAPGNDDSLSASGGTHEISKAKIANTSYMILSPAVRYRLTAAGENFTVRLRDGVFQFAHPSLVAPYDEVRLLSQFAAYGNLAGDDKEEALAVLEIGSGDDSRKEVAVLSSSGGTVEHIASYLLGHADIVSVRVQKKAIHVKARHSLPGDPGLRTTEFVFVVEK